MISPNSFCILLAEVLRALDIFGVAFSFFPLSGESLLVLLPPASRDIWNRTWSSLSLEINIHHCLYSIIYTIHGH